MSVTCTHAANEYGLFKPDEDPTKGRWLDLGRTLEYYHLKSGVSLSSRSRLGRDKLYLPSPTPPPRRTYLNTVRSSAHFEYALWT